MRGTEAVDFAPFQNLNSEKVRKADGTLGRGEATEYRDQKGANWASNTASAENGLEKKWRNIPSVR